MHLSWVGKREGGMAPVVPVINYYASQNWGWDCLVGASLSVGVEHTRKHLDQKVPPRSQDVAFSVHLKFPNYSASVWKILFAHLKGPSVPTHWTCQLMHVSFMYWLIWLWKIFWETVLKLAEFAKNVVLLTLNNITCMNTLLQNYVSVWKIFVWNTLEASTVIVGVVQCFIPFEGQVFPHSVTFLE